MAPFFLVAGGVLAVDFISKSIVRATMPLGYEIRLLPVFSLTHVENTGIAFGMFQDRNLILIGVALVVTAVMLRYGLQMLPTDRPSAFAMAAIVGGALGNLIDRIAFGRVTDFFDAYIGAYHWPVFNVADSAICVGAAIVAIRGIFFSRGS